MDAKGMGFKTVSIRVHWRAFAVESSFSDLPLE
jgi:hypothetical protein